MKDSKLHTWLKDKLPGIGNAVGTLLPDSGVLGIIKNAIVSSDLPAADKLEGIKLANDFELAMTAEMTKRIVSVQDTERVQLAQEDLLTKRARPIRQYAWLLFIFVCYPLAYFVKGEYIDVPDVVIMGVFADFGFYTFNRTREKLNNKQ